MLSRFSRRVVGGMRLPKTSIAAPMVGASFSSKKLGIGDALSVLEEKISKISQLVGSSLNSRTTSKSTERLSQLVMVLPVSTDCRRFKQEKWSSSAQESAAWL